VSRTWKRLAGPLLITNSAVTRYTVPAGTKAIIRNIHIANNAGTAVDVTLSIGADAAGTRILDAVAVAGDGVLDLYGPFVMDAAEILQSNASATNQLTLTVSGEEITLG
jgi:hypothetical protein